MPQISVIVPVYKTEKYLDRCVKSILSQTYSNIELILVDDGSPDKCPEMCDQYALEDSRVRVVHEKNSGVSVARNTGLNIASGNYITFVDSDDYIEPDMYEKMMDKAVSYDCDVVMCDCVKEFENHTSKYSHDIRSGFYDYEQLKKEYYPHLLIMENIEYPATISNWSILWKSRLNTMKMRYESGVRYSEDLLFGAKLMYEARSFYYMKDEFCYHYVMNSNSASHVYTSNKWNDYRCLHAKIVEEFGTYVEYDFLQQIDRCLLFFLYNVINETLKAECKVWIKLRKIKNILSAHEIIEMFRRTSVCKLQVSFKLKILTLLFKYRVGIFFLVMYYGRKNENKCCDSGI